MPTIDDLRAVLHARESYAADIDSVLLRAPAKADHRRRTLAVSAAVGCVLAVAAGLVISTWVSGDGSTSPVGAPPDPTYTYTGATPAGKLIPAGQRQRARSVTGDLLGGGSFDLSAHDGRVVLVTFWASWCGPCQGQLAALQRTADRADSVPITIVGIDSAESSKTAPRAFVREHRIGYPVVWDPQGRTGDSLGGIPVQSLPVTVLIDKQQRVAAVYLGMTSASDIEGAVEHLAVES